MNVVYARSWCRVDLAGGTLDIWPLGLLHPGARTVNVAVDLEASVELREGGSEYVVRAGERRFTAASTEALAAEPATALIGVVASALELPPFEAVLTSTSPRGGGLGASSALGVAFVAAAEELLGSAPSEAAERAALVRDLEARLMGLPTGVQDHYPGLLGGALEIRYLPGGEVVRRLAVDLRALGESLVVAFSGEAHLSGATNWGVVRRRLDGEAESIRLFSGIAETAEALAEALEEGRLETVGQLMAVEWSHRRRLAPEVETVALKRLLGAARSAGAWGGKACGAGGGGCVAVLCPPSRRQAVSSALERSGARVLPCRPTAKPLRVVQR